MNQADLLAQVEKRRKIYNESHTAQKISDIPDGTHFAVLCNDTLSYDDGYGQGTTYATKNFINYIFFDSEEALSAWIIENHSKKTFRVISTKKVDYQMETKIVVTG